MEERPIVQEETDELWVVLPGVYEKWVHPANKNDKHYRVILRSNKGRRRVGDTPFNTATEALAFADAHNLPHKEGSI